MHSAGSWSMLLAVTAAAVLVAFASGATIGGTWKPQSKVFTPRDKFGLICDGTKMHVFGGRDSNGFTKTMFKYETTTKEWSEVFPTGKVTPRFGGAMQKVGTKFYYLTGYSEESSPAPTEDVWSYDTVTEFWEQVVPTGAIFQPRGRFSSTVVGTKIFIFGGITETGVSNEVWSFDTATSTWKLENTGKVAPFPEPRFDPCCVYYSATTETICFGGTGTVNSYDELWRYNHATNVWSKVNPTTSARPPARRLAVCAAPTATSMMIYTGWNNTASTFDNGKQSWTYNFATNVWQPIDQVTPIKRDSANMCKMANGDIYLLGGSGDTGRLNDVWKLNLANSLFESVSVQTLRPKERWGHGAARIGTQMIVAFGNDGRDRIVDAWHLDLTTMKWIDAKEKNAPLGREGVSAVSRGNDVYFFGGVTSQGVYTNTLYAYDVSTLEFKLIDGIGGTKHPAVAYHAAAIIADRMLVIGGLTSSSSSSQTNTVSLYDFELNTWSTVDIATGEVGARAHHSLVPEGAGNDLLVIGGFSPTIALFDKIRVNLDQVRGADGTFRWTLVETTAPNQVNVVTSDQQVRGEQTVAGFGSHFLICGGARSNSFPVTDDTACYEWDSATGAAALTTTPDYVSSKASAIYFGKQTIVFGGELGSGALRRGVALDSLLVYEFNTVCADRRADKTVTTLNDGSCIHCSPGTQNPTTTAGACAVAAAGTYFPRSYYPLSQCQPGSYGVSAGASALQDCLLCASGEFTNVSGASACTLCINPDRCPLGSSQDSDGSTGSQKRQTSFTEDQPQRFQNKNIPVGIYIPIVSFFILLALLFCFAVLLGRRQRELDRKHFFTEEATETLQKVFDKYKYANYGISEAMLFNALYEPDVLVHPDFTVEMASDIFRDQDTDGSGYADFTEFLTIVCKLTIAGQCQPQPHTPAAQELADNDTLKREGLVGFVRGFQFSMVDMFSTGHRIGKIGDAIRLQQTTIGGVMTIVFGIAALFLALALGLQFGYTNFFETRSTTPAVILQREVSGNAIMQLKANEGSQQESDCYDPTSSSGCARGAIVGAFNNEGRDTKNDYDVNASSISCSWEASTKSCYMTYNIKNWKQGPLTTTYVHFSFPSKVYATSIDAKLEFESGVLSNNGKEMTKSIGYIHVEQPRSAADPDQNDGRVFRGWPSTTINVDLNPTFFTYYNLFTAAPAKFETGYHVQVKSVAEGNRVDESSFPQFFSVPVILRFDIDDFVLTVDRQPSQSGAQFISSVLGAISGLSAAALAFVTFIDGRKQAERDKEFDKVIEEKMEKISSSRHLRSDEQQLKDRQLVSPLVTGGVNIHVADETLKLIRRVVAFAFETRDGKRNSTLFTEVSMPMDESVNLKESQKEEEGAFQMVSTNNEHAPYQ